MMFILFLNVILITASLFSMDNQNANVAFCMLEVCQKCGKGEVTEKFKKCSKCQKAYYCSVECQKKDWKEGHRQDCGNEVRHNERINEIQALRKKYMATLTELVNTHPKKEQTERENYSELLNELELYGEFARISLRESIIAARIEQDTQALNTLIDMYRYSQTPDNIAMYPNQTNEPWFFALQQMIVTSNPFEIRFRKSVSGNAPNEEHYNKQIAFYRSFEPMRGSSLHLVKNGYPKEAIAALEQLRRQACALITHLMNPFSQFEINFEQILKIWAYHLLSAFPCLHEEKIADLSACVTKPIFDEETIIKLFSCIQHDTVLRNALSQNPRFIEGLGNKKRVLTKILSNNVKQVSFSKALVYLKNKLKKVSPREWFACLALYDDQFLVHLASLYIDKA